MKAFVVDACVAVKWFLDEEYKDDAVHLLGRQYELHAPDFLFLEFDSVLCKMIRNGLITEAESDKARDTFTSIPIKFYADKSLRETAYSIANQTRCSIYDGLYVALAVFLNKRLVTADRRLFNSMAHTRLKKHLLWVEDTGKIE